MSEESRKWAADMSDEVRARARKRSELFRAGQRFYHDQYGEGVVVSSVEGMTTIRYDSGEEHTYSYESQRKLKPVVDDAHKLTPGALFDMVRAPVNLPAPATPSYTRSASSRPRALSGTFAHPVKRFSLFQLLWPCRTRIRDPG